MVWLACWPGNIGKQNIPDHEGWDNFESKVGRLDMVRERGNRGGMDGPLYKPGMVEWLKSHPNGVAALEIDCYRGKSTPVSNFFPYKDVLAGKCDKELDQLAAQAIYINTLGPYKMRIELQSEANIDSHYSGTPEEAMKYQAYVVNRFAQRGVKKVQWCLSLTGKQWDGKVNPYCNYDVIDIICLDAYVDFKQGPYNVQNAKTFANMTDGIMAHSAAHGLPWAFTEHGVQENPKDAQWKANFYKGVKSHLASLSKTEKPRFVVWNYSDDGSGGWPFDTSPQAEAAFIDMAASF